MGIKRRLLLAAGFLCLALATLGIFLPLLPTVPFVILAASCFARSSARCYDWLLSSRAFGRPLRDYLEKKGVSWRDRIPALVFLWAAILVSALLLTHRTWLRVLLFVIAVGVTVHLALLKRPQADEGEDSCTTATSGKS